MDNRIVEFIRQKNFRLVQSLGNGACGETVLLRDDEMGLDFVCKKFVPYSDAARKELFARFMDEIKCLLTLSHPNVVRVYHYYLYTAISSGYILMEYIRGRAFDEFLADHPEMASDVFEQCIDAFWYLEQNSVLHRDVRPPNIMVTNEGAVKVIDFGFAKHGEQVSPTRPNSVTTTAWCESPPELQQGIYDVRTEIYYLGRMFTDTVRKLNISGFRYLDIAAEMCETARERRPRSFSDITPSLARDGNHEDFSDEERAGFGKLYSLLVDSIWEADPRSRVVESTSAAVRNLDALYRRTLLLPELPIPTAFAECFVEGTVRHDSELSISSVDVKRVADFLRQCPREKSRIVLLNLSSFLEARKTKATAQSPSIMSEDDIPF